MVFTHTWSPGAFSDKTIAILWDLYISLLRTTLNSWELDQDNNFYLISMSIFISCWLENVCLILFWTVPLVDCYWNRILLCSHLPHWYKGTSKKSELRNHHNRSYGRAGNNKDISFSNNGHAKTNFCVRKADNTVELKAARLCDCFLVLHLIYLKEVY